MSDWVDLTDTPASKSTDDKPHTAETLLISRGLTPADAAALISVTGAAIPSDFAMMDDKMVAEAAASVGIKLIPAKRWELAVAEQRGCITHATKPPDMMTTPETTAPAECIAICIDRSGSMGAGFDEPLAHGANSEKTLARRSRMDAVKQVFYAFRDRVESLSETGASVGERRLALLQFDNVVEPMLALTANFDAFEAIVDEMKQRGATAIYSAIVAACGMLEPVAAASPRTDLRVLCLTDGRSNSGVAPEAALAAAHAIGAVVDAIIVGDTPDDPLRQIVAATGGECFQIRALSEGFELMEAEGVASLRARRGGADRPPPSAKPATLQSVAPRQLTRGAAAAKAVAPPPPPAAVLVVDVAKAVAGGGGGGGPALPGVKRILKELSQVAKGEPSVWLHSGEGVHLFPDASDARLMRALVEGPVGSPFEGGVFALDVRVPESYPMRAPSVTFTTAPYHCNVSEGGRVCLDILESKWSPALSIPKAIESVRMMLANPDTDNALRQWIAELTIAERSSDTPDARYSQAAREATARDAARSVAEWKALWGVDAGC